MQQWFAQAPSNIALIKYMGKLDSEKNIPINPSLSYTLNQLLSSVSLETHHFKNDIWEPLTSPGYLTYELTTAEQNRYLNHLQRIKKYFNYTGNFIVRSANNFPDSTGLASSASSFAALTKCAVLALCELTNRELLPVEEQAQLSRLGSGSSCRSFFSPWALWEGKTAHAIELPYQKLMHQAIIISHEKKMISSKEAHSLVTTSPLYPAREQQANEHLQSLIHALQQSDWKKAYQICWKEFQDMHDLFSTCLNSFDYMTPKTKEVLQLLQDFWESEGDGPIVTMDAGPNIHLLYRMDQSALAYQFKQQHLLGNFDVF